MPDLPDWSHTSIQPSDLPASVVSGSSSPFTAIEGSGHSYMAGQVATGNHGYLAKLGAMLGLNPTNRGVGGAALVLDQNSGAGNGYAKVLQDLPRASGSAPYLPASNLYVVDFGLNDLSWIAATPAAILTYKSALRAILSRIRAAAVFEEVHASVTLAGVAWTVLSTQLSNSGLGFEYAVANGGTITIAVPADFPGGTIALGLMVPQASGATYTTTVDAVAAGAVNTVGLAPAITGKTTNHMCAVQRLTGLTPGAHTIVSTGSAFTTWYGFDYWQIEAPEPPTILLVQQPRLPTYAAYSGSNFTPTDAMVQALNVAQRQVAAEFDSKVIPVDLDTLMNVSASLFGSGSTVNQAHPNDAGHSLIANALLRAAQPGPWLPTLATAS